MGAEGRVYTSKLGADRSKDGMHRIGRDALRRELEEAGFEPAPAEDTGQRWFMIVAAKPHS